MLVLSRRPDEKILLPSVPAVFKVLSSQAGLVRLGIEAPAHVPILREELARGEKLPECTNRNGRSQTVQPSSRHIVRNHLNNLNLALTLLRMQMSQGEPSLLRTLDGIREELQVLREHLIGESEESVSVDTMKSAPVR